MWNNRMQQLTSAIMGIIILYDINASNATKQRWLESLPGALPSFNPLLYVLVFKSHTLSHVNTGLVCNLIENVRSQGEPGRPKSLTGFLRACLCQAQTTDYFIAMSEAQREPRVKGFLWVCLPWVQSSLSASAARWGIVRCWLTPSAWLVPNTTLHACLKWQTRWIYIVLCYLMLGTI